MKRHSPLFRVTLALFAFGATSFAATAAPEPRPDPAAQHLAQHGAVSITSAGPFVTRGSYRVQVSTKFGRPDVVLADGTWMYHHRRIEGSVAEGTLVVRFDQGRVSALSLVTPTVATAMRTHSSEKHGTGFVARH